MRKKNIIAAGITSVAMLLVPNIMCTPVLAGVTKGDIQSADNTRLNSTFSTVTIGNREIWIQG